MVHKSIKLDTRDIYFIQFILDKDISSAQGPSQALRICFERAAYANYDWEEIAAERSGVHISDSIENETMNKYKEMPVGFVVEEQIFNRVFNQIKQALNLSKLRTAYVIRLCLFAHYRSLSSNKTLSNADDNSSEVNELDMVKSLIELIERSRSSEVAKNKVEKIKQILF